MSMQLNSSRILPRVKALNQEIAFLFAIGNPNSLLTWENSLLFNDSLNKTPLQNLCPPALGCHLPSSAKNPMAF